ncbi:MAG: DUF6783 domain-containing protein [Lacrimispora saccharolytica]
MKIHANCDVYFAESIFQTHCDWFRKLPWNVLKNTIYIAYCVNFMLKL